MLFLLLSWFSLSDARVSSLWDLFLFAGSRSEELLTSEVMALAWAIYLCGAQCFAWHITCKTHLDAQFCSSLNFIQCQEYARHPAFLLGQRGEVWAAMPPLDSGRCVFSSQNTPVFLCWQEWFPAQWIAQAQKRTTENHIGSLSEI